MKQEQLKQEVARAALEFVENDTVIGVGTGSTVNFFNEALAESKVPIESAESISDATTQRLQ
ncbi:MAG TPA: ribose 5-phosphate isomerase A, partial [Xanthomonadales bacterium]|nr:ribose 5-phosphate isomerase A [Xanthomonadales bacterium]